MKSRILIQVLGIAFVIGWLTAHPASAQLPFDVRGTSSGVAPVVALTRAPLSLDITFQNLGTNTIWEMQVNYRINQGPVQVMTYPFPAGRELVAQGGRQTIRHSARWTPPSVGQYTIKCWASGLNVTQTDGNPANDTVTNVVTIVAREAPRLSVLEIFTSGSCPICGAGAPTLEALEARHTSRIACLHYPQNIPGLGDFYRTTETIGRRNFYNIQAVPYAVLDGRNARPANQLTDAQVITRQAEPCFLSLDAVYTRQNSTRSLTVQAALTALGPGASPNLVLRAVVVEPRVSPSAASNGQLYLPHLVRKMLPTPSGVAVGALPMRATRTIQTAWTVPLTVPSCNIGALEVVVFAQDTVTNEIQQAVRARLNGVLATTDEIAPATTLGCWLTPNPATPQGATVSLSLAKGAQVGGELLDGLGRVVTVVPRQQLPAGWHTIPLVLTHARPGIYALRLLVDDKTISRRLVVE